MIRLIPVALHLDAVRARFSHPTQHTMGSVSMRSVPVRILGLPIVIISAALFVPLQAEGATARTVLRVPQDQPSIQAAINAAATGDTVLVSPGTYVEHI